MTRQAKTEMIPARITENVIREHVDAASFSRGQDYHRQELIFDARIEGKSRLKAQCEGSSGGPYHVNATVGKGEILDAECTCPVGVFCKHIVALLLTWKDRPETFIEVEGIDTVLQRKSKAELVALVKRMVASEPGLESMVEVPVPKAKGGKRGGSAVGAETYERQAAAVFRRNEVWNDYDDEDAYDEAGSKGAEELQPILDTGDDFLKSENYAAAAAVFEGVLNAFTEYHEEEFDDQAGMLAEAVDHCAEQLGRCLDGLKDDPVRREAILRALYEFDDSSNNDEARIVLVEKTTPQERVLVAKWVRDGIAELTGPTKTWADDHRRKSAGDLLLHLEADILDDEEYLKICRETGRTLDLIGRLLERKRLDEALQAAETLKEHELLEVAPLFLRRRHAKAIEDLVRKKSEKSHDRRLLDWLKDRAIKRKDWSGALELAEAIFRRLPSLADYQKVRELATKLKRWSSLRPQLMEFLSTRRDPRLIIEIHLDEGEIDEALDRLKSDRRPSPDAGTFFSHGWIELTVAEAAANKRPQAALEIYRDHAEQLINQQGRGNYKEACQHLKKVRDLYDKLGQKSGWADEARRLQQKYNRFPAFLDEMK